jgi:hypothetical protein
LTCIGEGSEVIPRIRVGALALGVGLALTACVDKADLEAEALAKWKAYCASQGKQFLWRDTVYEAGIVSRTVQTEGRCVGPGEKGYEKPSSTDDEP